MTADDLAPPPEVAAPLDGVTNVDATDGVSAALEVAEPESPPESAMEPEPPSVDTEPVQTAAEPEPEAALQVQREATPQEESRVSTRPDARPSDRPSDRPVIDTEIVIDDE